MPNNFIDGSAPSLQGGLPRRPEDLPRGLLTPPQEVRELLEKELAKHPPQVTASSRERMLNLWTVAYYFDDLELEVLYRQTPDGPVVLAVGPDEVLALRRETPLDEQRNIQAFFGD